MTISQKSIALILKHEGMNQPGKWPGGASGITLGRGYDLGYTTLNDFTQDWQPYLRMDYFNRLAGVIGRKGKEARDASAQLADIKVAEFVANRIFEQTSLPKYIALTAKVFPNADQLPADAFGALVSLVYNRGGSLEDKPGEDRRKEMRAIRDVLVAEVTRPLPEVLHDIAEQIRSMKRLWEGKNLGGLITRREEEAVLVERSET